MSDYRSLIERIDGSGMAFEVYEFHRKAHGATMTAGTIPAPGNSGVGTTINVQLPNPQVWRQLKIVLAGGSALLEPGALQYARGNLQVEVQKLNAKSNIFTRAITSAGTGESGFATSYRGNGEVWTEPTTKHFIVASMDGPQDALLLDDRAFYACEGTISLKTHIHNSVQGLLSGNSLMQPKLEGKGTFVIECPVPANEIEEIDVRPGEEVIVDGEMILMYSAHLTVELAPLVRGLRNLYRSGEGLVYKIRGSGKVWITPTVHIGH